MGFHQVYKKDVVQFCTKMPSLSLQRTQKRIIKIYHVKIDEFGSWAIMSHLKHFNTCLWRQQQIFNCRLLCYWTHPETLHRTAKLMLFALKCKGNFTCYVVLKQKDDWLCRHTKWLLTFNIEVNVELPNQDEVLKTVLQRRIMRLQYYTTAHQTQYKAHQAMLFLNLNTSPHRKCKFIHFDINLHLSWSIWLSWFQVTDFFCCCCLQEI